MVDNLLIIEKFRFLFNHIDKFQDSISWKFRCYRIKFRENKNIYESHVKLKYFMGYFCSRGEIVEPRQDRPSEGFLKFSIDLS